MPRRCLFPAPLAWVVRMLVKAGARVDEVSPSIEERSGLRVARIRCEVSDPQRRLKPGMTGEGRIDCGERRSLAVFGRKLTRLLRIEFW